MNSPNPNSLKSRFTKGLVKALIRINNNHPRSSSSSSISSSPREIRRRYHKIKTAAYASMACAVGRRRAWSRALLWKIRNKACNGGVVRRSIGSRSHYSIKKRVQQNKVNELRKVVPGGEGMDTWSLLEETAHYMKCLTTQLEPRGLAYVRINRQRSISSSTNIPSPMEMCRRYLSVKNAADAAMASAVGTRRAWSRTLLTKINRSHKGSQIYNCSARRADNSKKRMKMKKCDDEEEIGTICEADELRKFVPGGEAMDICSMLDEAAHYIKCLKTQVKVMEKIADICSAV
ncbi:unnamed protein product [Malus baccata var. baccata]